jgi:maltooligosyltrehalose trehalohydrolase
VFGQIAVQRESAIKSPAHNAGAPTARLFRHPEGKVAISRRTFPIGAEVLDEGVDFRVWAPNSRYVSIQSHGKEVLELKAEVNGYFSGLTSDFGPDGLYKIKLDSGSFPDPASRFQPEGPYGASQIIDPRACRWTDEQWPGIKREGQVIYEIHIGTFTQEGNWRAAMEQLPELASLGVTVIELMPLAEFPGRFGWGYDGTCLFAPSHLYGTPDEFRAFVDRAHMLGIGVILDVVYNHIGPDGNYLPRFSKDYFTDRYTNEWGEALNFDGRNSHGVREFFLTNAAYWISEFHLDGLRLDATQQIFDGSETHILAELGERVREAGKNRSVYLVAENEKQEARLVCAREQGGFGLDALWNDDFHHSAIVAATGHSEAYYSDHAGSPQEFISAMKYGYLFQGQWYSWQKQQRGTSTRGLHPANFVNYIQNHDQIANSLRGQRLHELTSAGRYRALTALLLLGSGTPMLFQGQEFAASPPFLYFSDHNPELAKLVKEGRRKFLSQFPSMANLEDGEPLANPEKEETFLSCKLNFAEREQHKEYYALHRDLLKLRRKDPVFHFPRPGGLDGAVLGLEAFALRYFSKEYGDRLLLLNLGPDLQLTRMPEPLLAPVRGSAWHLIWSSEDPRYGGSGTPALGDGCWHIPGCAALVLAPDQTTTAKNRSPREG